jgi:asparagine synthase (glutamine-hydrolysing)
VLREKVQRMCDAIVHRGPDDEGFFITPDVALGARRLSIIDVAGGHQPMVTADATKAIAFNGEIYNHRSLRRELTAQGRSFHTECDTETVLGAFDAWGAGSIRRLEGMFAAALWDAGSRTLTLARDWLGQKSIYYAETSDGFAFASEIKAILALGELPRELDVRALSDYMSMRYLPDERTFFRRISKMPPAHLLRVRGGERPQLERYWTPSYGPKHSGSEQAVLEELDHLLGSVVAEHLMSDVPLGCFLSGGIDSSLVVAYAARARTGPLRTFSIGVDEESQSELPWARQVAERYGTEHFEKLIQPDLARLAPRMVAAMEEPVDPFSAGVYVVSQIASEHVTVCLGGDGGDELFAGYDRYVGQELAEFYAHVPAALRRGVLRPLFARVPESFGYKSLATRLRWLDRMSELEGFERYAESAAFLRFPHELKRELFAPALHAEACEHRSEQLLARYFGDGAADALVDRMLHADCMTRLADHQLPIVDRMSMAHSLEVRSPFLDHRVAEFAMRIPAAWKMKRRRIKYMTRKLGERYLSHELLYRTKQGFGFPLGLWLRGPLRPLIERTIAQSRLAAAGIFQREAMQQLCREHVSGTIDHNYRLWMLFNLELFYRHYIEGESVSDLEQAVEQARTSPQSSPA